MSSILLTPISAKVDDTNPAGTGYIQHKDYLAFQSAADEICYWRFPLPADYSSTPALTILWSASSATAPSGSPSIDNVVWAAQIDSKSTGEGMNAEAYSTAVTVSAYADNSQARGLVVTDLSLSNNPGNGALAAEDYVIIKFYRDISAEVGPLAEDARVYGVIFSYTAA